MVVIATYINLPVEKAADRDSALLECQKHANAYFNHAEDFVGNSNLLGAHTSALWAQGFAENCAEILGSMPGYFEFLGTGFQNSSRLGGVPYMPGETAYANMQRMVVRYLSRGVAKELEDKFDRVGLPTYGFKNKAKDFMNRDKLLSFIFGVGFLSIMLIIALIKPDPSNFQYNVFRTVLALAGAGIGAVVPGILSVNVGKAIRAGGAIAVFIVVYFWNPAQLAAA